MRFDIITIFPAMMEAILGESILGRARNKGLFELHIHDLRAYTLDKHRRVDDYPYGGGMGMILQVEPVYRCIEALTEEIGEKPHVIYMSPKGRVFSQAIAGELTQKYENVCLLCGHYEGLDQRAIDLCVDEEISIGDYVLTGGELPAAVVTDACCRLLPGVLSADVCFEDESHYSGLLEYPQYTRPAVFQGLEVPEVLQNGHHAKIEKWRREQALLVTKQHRPDLLKKAELTREDKAFLNRLEQICLEDEDV